MDSHQRSDEKKYDSGIFKKPKLPPAQTPSVSASQTLRKSMHIGFSPVPGIKLQKILSGHTKGVNRVAYSPDGKYLATPLTTKPSAFGMRGAVSVSLLWGDIQPVSPASNFHPMENCWLPVRQIPRSSFGTLNKSGYSNN